MGEIDSLKKDLPHLIVLVVLVVLLLVVLTKFQWVHCSQIPGWCNVYCNSIMRTHSRVGLISGFDGIGDPDALYSAIQKQRGYTYIERLDVGQLSSGVLKTYDLVVLERMKSVTSRQAQAIRDYASRGGSILWIGDAASNQTADPYDVLKANETNNTFYFKLYRELLRRNETIQGDYAQDQIRKWEDTDDYKILNGSKVFGFGKLRDIIGARYASTNVQKKLLDLQLIDHTHLISKGLRLSFTTGASTYAVLAEDASRVNKLASIKAEDGREHPGILEAKYAGKVVFVAFPLEQANSTTLLNNVVDYLVPC